MKTTLTFAPRVWLVASMSAIILAACAAPVDEAEEVLEDPVVPAVVEESPAEPEGIGDAPEGDDAGNVVTLAQVQKALSQCESEREIINASCSASDDGTSYTCRYSLDGDAPETEREAIIAADGDDYKLIEIPEDCNVQ